ncbi:MAG: M20 family metallopeptidase [Caldicoprobacterales bacterium]|nr:M20 family metallopeptidase [Clostridiales bacterium]
MSPFESLVTEYIDKNQSEMVSLLAKLVAFDTQNFISYGREKECQEYIASIYEKLGLETDLFAPTSIPGIKEHPDFLDGRAAEDRPNVVGVYKAENETGRVMLAAHTDTMPVGDPEKWTVSPFGGEIKDGKMFGLGIGDNKFGLATSYFALKAVIDSNIPLRKSVVLCAYSDEEYGGGNGALASALKYPCDVIVNTDGGSYEIWMVAPGGSVYEIKLKTVKPVDSAAKMIDALYKTKARLEQFADKRRMEMHNNKWFRGTDLEKGAYRITEFSVGKAGANLDTGQLTFVFYTDQAKEAIERELKAIESSLIAELEGEGIVTEGFYPTTRFFHYQEADKNDPAIALMTELASDEIGYPIKQSGASLSDLSLFLKYGSKSSFNFGIFGDFARAGGAHQPDEYVELRELLAHAKALARFIVKWCT